mmetsp:Transcript_6937/g.9011  ORF Transcript_6937/g.9011 Transcript_6937/m.9011 type:complete len:217 (+) Transcript_6937:159-809(+)
MGRNLKKEKRKRPRAKLIVNFDKEARKEYLLGFSKRKKQRREKAIEDLKARVKAEKKQALEEQREAFMSSRKKASEEDDEEVEESNDDAEARNLVSEISEVSSKATTVTEEIKDEFSKQAFGNSTVKITTTTLGLSEDEESETEEMARQLRGWGKFNGKKNVKTQMGKAEKTLRRLQEQKKKGNKSKKKKGKGGETHSRKRKKAGARERRRRTGNK